jgi:hypothetical protein
MNKLIITFFAVIIFLPGCVYAARVDGPYEGKVIDADTGEPVEGVVILGVWYTSQFSPAGATHNYYDARETVTDKNGEFSIPGMGLRVLSNLEPMDFLIFKSGYEYIGIGPWESLKKAKFLKEKIKWEGDKAIIPLRKLTVAERRKQGSPDFPSEITEGKMKWMLEEINKDRLERGLTPYRLRGK